MRRQVAAGIIVSFVTHAAAGAGIYFGMVRENSAPIVAELDLSMAPLSLVMPNAGGGAGSKPQEKWVLPKKGKAPAPMAQPILKETKEEVVKQENVTAPCAEPCPEGTGDGGGGTGEGEGQYIPAEKAARQPRWIRKFITSSDYPLVARQQGKDGLVVLTVLIDSEGIVRDARLMEGAYDALNEVALRKVRNAKFSPAYNQEGRAVSCKVTLPIRFKLR